MKRALLVLVFLLIGCNSGGTDPLMGTGGGAASSGGGSGATGGGTSSSTGGGSASTGGGTSSSTGGGSASTGGGTSSSTGGGSASTGGGTSTSMGGGTASGGGTGATGGGSSASGGGSACTPPTFATAVTPANTVELIVTRNVYAAGFQKLADLHTALGTPAAVLTLETLCTTRTCTDSDVKNDTIKALKDELISRTGLKYVLLGGAFDTVPARIVSDSYTDPLVPSYTYSATYPSDYYYSDFSEWDTNHDGVYADPTTDTPAYLPSVAVSRLPVRSTTDVDRYVAKVLHHLTAHGTTGAHHTLLVSNIATTLDVFGASLPVDSAYYFVEPGRTLSLLPANEVVDKLYATSTVDLSAQLSTPANELLGLDAAPDIVVHSGHAGGDDLMTEQDGSNAFTSSDAQSLTNPDYPFFFSCGCEAGDSSTPGNAGEALINAPTGGAIAYLGNVPVGLGIAGGMQLIDETLRYVQGTTDAVLGDAYFAGHQNLPKMDTFTVPVIGISAPVVDANSWRWTQKGVMIFGDLALPMWSTSRPFAPTVTATRTDVCEGAALSFTLSAAFTGTLRVAADGKLYAVTLSNQASATLDVESAAHHLEVGLESSTAQFGYQTFDL